VATGRHHWMQEALIDVPKEGPLTHANEASGRYGGEEVLTGTMLLFHEPDGIMLPQSLSRPSQKLSAFGRT